MTKSAIHIQGITKIFDHKTVVDHISLDVKQGAIFGFLGSNGSGKTTTIRMICGLLTPTEGTGECLGFDIRTQAAEIKKQIGYMPQKFCLYNNLSVLENLQFFATLYQLSHPKQAIENILEDLLLQPYRNIKAGHLSGGWKQRLTLACCLVHQPQLLFLDEPTAGIDPKARKDFWDYLHKISLRDGTTVLVTTHYMDEAEKCTDLAYINLGKLLYVGKTSELIPFSKVKTYVIEGDRHTLSQLIDISAHQYPDLLVSMVNNTIRVSSQNKSRLDEFLREEKKYHPQQTIPNFEEVFIGLMQSC